MVDTKIYFAEDGITSTSANFTANMAKEYYRRLEAELKYTSFYNKDILIVSKDERYRMETGLTTEQLDAISGKIRKIYAAKALIAWLREAIKQRERMMEEVKEMSIEEYVKLTGKEAEDIVDEEVKYENNIHFSTPMRPAMPRATMWSLMLLRQRQEELRGAREALAGAMEAAREYAKGSPDEPLAGNGVVLKGLYVTAQTAPMADIDNTQKAITEAIKQNSEKLRPLAAEEGEAMSAANLEFGRRIKELRRKSDRHKASLWADLKIYRAERLREISRLKIVIPPSLEDIYNEVNSLGKK